MFCGTIGIPWRIQAIAEPAARAWTSRNPAIRARAAPPEAKIARTGAALTRGTRTHPPAMTADGAPPVVDVTPAHQALQTTIPQFKSGWHLQESGAAGVSQPAAMP